MNDYINDSCLEAWKKTIQEMTEDELLDNIRDGHVCYPTFLEMAKERLAREFGKSVRGVCGIENGLDAPHKGTRELFLETLTKMGVEYKINEFEELKIWFEYQDLYFCAIANEECWFITVEYADFKVLSDFDDVRRMHRVVNKVNEESGVVISFDTKFVNYRKNFLFIAEIPAIENYLQSELKEFARAHKLVNDEWNKLLENEKKNASQRSTEISNEKHTKELFIKTITELGCSYEMWEVKDSDDDSILFEYKNVKYRAYIYDYCREVDIMTHYSVYSVELSNVDEISRLRTAVNNINHDYNVITTYFIDNESKFMHTICRITIPFMAEITGLIDYLVTHLDELHDVVSWIFENEMDELRKEEE